MQQNKQTDKQNPIKPAINPHLICILKEYKEKKERRNELSVGEYINLELRTAF